MKRISQSGRNGVKRADLKKEFQHIAADATIESLLENGEIVMDKKGTAYYLWEAGHFLKHLLETDSRFRVLYTKIEEMKVILEHILDHGMMTSTSTTTRPTEHYPHNGTGPGPIKNHGIAINKEQFGRNFRLALQQNSNSSGWVSLSRIREQMNKAYGISQEEFYSLVEEISNKEYETYELSSGGSEGIIIRGLLHGFIRCI
jgi:hypothetical protein